MERRHLKYILAGILALAFLIRVYHIDQPLIEGVSGGQIERATVARNFYRTGDFLVPQIDIMPQPHPLFCEFPLYTWTVALLYLMVGGVYEWIGRFVSIIFFMGTALLFYAMVRRVFDEKVGGIALACFCFLPNSIMFSRSFSLDTMNLFFSIGMLYYFFLWCEERKWGYFLLSLLLGVLTYLTRIITIFMVVPMVYLAYTYWGRRFITRYQFWMYHILSLLPSVLWYRYAQLKMIEFYGETHMGISTYFDLSSYIAPLTYLNYASLKMLFEYVSGMTLTPVGFTLAMVGVLLEMQRSRERVFLFWLCGVVASFIIYANKIPALNYYLFLVPPASVYIAKSCVFFWKKGLQLHSYLRHTVVRVAVVMVMGVMIFGYGNSGYTIPSYTQHCLQVAEAVKRCTQPEDPVIWHGPTALLYYADRKGWKFIFTQEWIAREMEYWRKEVNRKADPIAYLEVLRAQGACYFVSMYTQEVYHHTPFSEYLLSNYRVVDEVEGRYVIVHLQSRES